MMSEDTLKQYMNELKLPKESLGALLKGVSKSKEEIINRIGGEFSQLIQKIDVVDELTKFLRENKVKCSMEIEFSKKNNSTEKASKDETASEDESKA